MTNASLGWGLLATLALPLSSAIAAPNVVVTIKPIHALVAGVMDGIGEPTLLIDGAQSPHGFAMRPSDAAKLEKADLVFWVGPELEIFLEGPLESLAGDAQSLALIDVDGLNVLELREGGLFEAHADHEDHEDGAETEHAHDDASGGEDHDEHDHAEDDHADHDHAHEGEDDHAHEDHAHEGEDAHAGHDHGALDAHVWLDTDNARLMVAAIAEALIAADPDNASAYNANGAALAERLSALDAELVETLGGVEGAWFAFHDAYQAFEVRYGVEATGTFTVNPDIAPGAARLVEIRDTIEATGAACIFAEPQFSSAVIDTVAAETGAEVGVLDPLGAELEPGQALYFELMRGMAANLADCLQ